MVFLNKIPFTIYFRKSFFQRQVCMLQILAQMGCMVPAESATMVPMTRIFSRVGHNDDLVQNLSGFAVEVILNLFEPELLYILMFRCQKCQLSCRMQTKLR